MAQCVRVRRLEPTPGSYPPPPGAPPLVLEGFRVLPSDQICGILSFRASDPAQRRRNSIRQDPLADWIGPMQKPAPRPTVVEQPGY